MGMVLPVIMQLLLKLCLFGVAFSVQGSTEGTPGKSFTSNAPSSASQANGLDISPSPAIFSGIPPVEGTPDKSFTSNAPSSASQPSGSVLHRPTIPTITSTPAPQMDAGLVPSLSPSTLIKLPPYNTAPPPIVFPAHEPSLSPSSPLTSSPFTTAPPPSLTPRTPVASSPSTMAPSPLIVQGRVPSARPSAPPGKVPVRKSHLLPGKPFTSNAPSSASQPNGSILHPPITSPPVPQMDAGLVPSLSPSTPIKLPPYNTAPPPIVFPAHEPSLSPSSPLTSSPFTTAPPPSLTPSTPVASSPSTKAPSPLIVQGTVPSMLPSASPGKLPVSKSHSLPGKSFTSNAPSSASQSNGSILHPPTIPPITSTPVPQMDAGLVPSLSPSTPIKLPPYRTAPPPVVFPAHEPSLSPSSPLTSSPFTTAPPPSLTPSTPVASSPSTTAPSPLIVQGPVPSVLPSAPPGKVPVSKSPVSVPGSPVGTPLGNSQSSPQQSPSTLPTIPGALQPVTQEKNASNNKAPITETTAPAPSPTTKPRQNSTVVHPVIPGIASSPLPVPVPSPNQRLSPHSPAIHPVVPGESPSVIPDPDVPPSSTPLSSIDRKKYGIPVAAPPYEIPKPPPPPVLHSPTKAPSTHKSMRQSSDAPVPNFPSPKSPESKGYHSPASPPSTSLPKHNDTRNKITSPAPSSSYFVSPTASIPQGPVHPPTSVPTSSRGQHPHPPIDSVSPSKSPSHSSVSHAPPAPSPSPLVTSGQTEMPVFPPKISPSGSSTKSPKMPVLPPIRSLPPPPPNQDCSTTVCTEPLTNTPPGSPCGCVWPMQVGLRLSVALYTFFPLVSELAAEIASGVFMKQSQVRIMGANAASQQPEKTVVLIDLVPLGEKFDNTTAFLIYHRFWHKQVVIKSSFFGDYEVLYVHYPGLPPSPPSASSDFSIIDDGPYSGNNARTIKPEGVNVPKRRQKNGLSGSIIAIIVLSAFVVVALCSAIAWVLLFKYRAHAFQPTPAPPALQTSHVKPSGAAGSMIGSGLDSASLSFDSSIATYTGSAKTFTASDIEKATGNFDASRILGEGGFGRVYSGVLDDGTKVAVKVLKRDDHQGGREFLAEVEMLSRLHHRNLVKLIGICIEEHARCLVYELIPNGSVESHLHGVDKESAPLGWDVRVKIALGAARGLAYLHEDSSPRVIHRDFKSSNILLEHDFTPKVSDFGLARTALDEGSRHISTRVMGTFGYVAPEYAMTGHLLVKSDVYSYGVVLLELLTGRKPVDMSQLPGQENLVAWARPLLTSKEGLETIIDPSLVSDVPFDSVAKVAAIASMCVQSEVQHRPFMGEVVQALKLVCNECDEAKEMASRSSSHGDLSIDMDARVGTGSGNLPDPLQSHYSLPNYGLGIDSERGPSISELFSSSARLGKEESASFRRCSSSGPLRTGSSKQFWQRVRRLSAGSVSEHGTAFRLWHGSY